MSRRMPGKIAGNALQHLLKKPATIAYPKGELIIDANYRGKLVFDSADCIGCKLCVRDCPANAITIENVGTKENKQFVCRLNMAHCIFCGQCSESCNKSCITLTPRIELSSMDKIELENMRI
ncbi:MAG: 4Fe-4S binding protein [Clostridiales bacterium]|nr:4Fe-4S binding protein [Clostridiales bacterium]